MTGSRLIALTLLLIAACGGDDSGEGVADAGESGRGGNGGTFNPDNPSGGAGGLSFDGGSGLGGSGGSGGSPVVTPPANLVETEIGGYALGPLLEDDTDLEMLGGEANGDGCSLIVGIARDFKPSTAADGHPDFDSYEGNGASKGLVADELGADGNPVYTGLCEADPDRTACPSGQQTTSESDFDAWYTSTPGINLPFAVFLSFEQQNGVSTFESNAFFPVDGAGYGDSDNKHNHNFGFTTEIHTKFRYEGGEQFTFTGDDDLWVFVNGKLAIDVGGLHEAVTDTLDLDARAADLGIETGETYALDLFHAERHFTDSNFRVDTTLAFTDCGSVGGPD